MSNDNNISRGNFKMQELCWFYWNELNGKCVLFSLLLVMQRYLQQHKEIELSALGMGNNYLQFIL